MNRRYDTSKRGLNTSEIQGRLVEADRSDAATKAIRLQVQLAVQALDIARNAPSLPMRVIPVSEQARQASDQHGLEFCDILEAMIGRRRKRLL